MLKLVDFDVWCVKCQYLKNDETEWPCNKCLTATVNEDSHKPIEFEEKAGKKS